MRRIAFVHSVAANRKSCRVKRSRLLSTCVYVQAQNSHYDCPTVGTSISQVLCPKNDLRAIETIQIYAKIGLIDDKMRHVR